MVRSPVPFTTHISAVFAQGFETGIFGHTHLQPYVADFGLAKFWNGQHLTVSEAVGTPAYVAPEQAIAGNCGAATTADVYSLGQFSTSY
jgi:serine/threonine protein kinase